MRHYDLFRGLELLTCNATVKLSSIQVDETTGTIIIPMNRQQYERKRSMFIGERYKLISSEFIHSILTIRNVVRHTITDNLQLTEIHILFGVNVRDLEIIIGSVEEQSGVHAFGMSIKVRSYDIELNDTER